MEYFKELIIDVVRFGYWVLDFDIVMCNCCDVVFKESDIKYYCCVCGMGVCSNCLESRRFVFFRGWDYFVRVCD